MSRWKDRVDARLAGLSVSVVRAERIAQEAFRKTCDHSYVDLENGIIVSARCVKCGEPQPGYFELRPGGPMVKKPRR